MSFATTPGTLADAFADQPQHAQTVERRRAFMAGALACMVLQQSGVPRDQLIAECIAFGRAIGTPAEKATL